MRKLIQSIIHFIKKIRVNFYYPEFKSLPIGPKTDRQHLDKAVQWLCYAQNTTGTGGVSAAYDISLKKWRGPYRETTGYIIETFVSYYLLTKEKKILEGAIKMADWEIEVMESDGGVAEKHPNGKIIKKIFNTGQVILGLITLFEVTKEQKYLDTAVKMADFIVSNQETNGAWEKYSTKGAKTIDTRVAHALLLVWKTTGKERYKTSAGKALSWTLGEQKENFWFNKTGFGGGKPPSTHWIAYTIDGILECWSILGKTDETLYKSFYGAAKKTLECFDRTKLASGFLAGTFDENWQSQDSYSCLTGNCQLAHIWIKIYKITKEKKFLEGAEKILDQVKSTQILDTKHTEIRGGILGSYPFSGDYAPFLLPNWATKFFADALICKQKIV